MQSDDEKKYNVKEKKEENRREIREMEIKNERDQESRTGNPRRDLQTEI